MNKDSAILLLQRARTLINAGWTQGKLQVADGDGIYYCALGAILGATGQDLENWSMTPVAQRLLMLVEQDEIVNQYETLVRFNDSPNRTTASVLAAFDRTIERLRKES